MASARIQWQDEYIEIDDIDNPDIGELESAMRFKAENIKAKADPELFVIVADALRSMSDLILKEAYPKRGHWKKDCINDCARCSNCGRACCQMAKNYCAYCGAEMERSVVVSDLEITKS